MSDLQVLFDRAFQPLAESVAAGRIPGGVLGIVNNDGTLITRAAAASPCGSFASASATAGCLFSGIG